MRLRITQPLKGSIDGITLDGFVQGCTDVVGTTLGSYLLALGAAEPVVGEVPGLITPLQQQLAREPGSLGGSFWRTLDRAADRSPRRPTLTHE